MGMYNTPNVFRSSCDRFFEIGDQTPSRAELEDVLRKLVAFYKNRAPYGKLRNIIQGRFDLGFMGFRSFDDVLSTYGFTVDDNFVVKSPLQIQKVVNE
jgi:hypothetical protein